MLEDIGPLNFWVLLVTGKLLRGKSEMPVPKLEGIVDGRDTLYMLAAFDCGLLS
jgi:hypothetical protein